MRPGIPHILLIQESNVSQLTYTYFLLHTSMEPSLFQHLGMAGRVGYSCSLWSRRGEESVKICAFEIRRRSQSSQAKSTSIIKEMPPRCRLSWHPRAPAQDKKHVTCCLMTTSTADIDRNTDRSSSGGSCVGMLKVTSPKNHLHTDACRQGAKTTNTSS